jgi:hypothetical protein
MSDHEKSLLRVIEGAGMRSDVSRPGGLALALEMPLSVGYQLALPWITPRCLIVSVSPAALFTRDLSEVLRSLRVRHFVDMRLAVEFGSLGLGRRRFESVMKRLGLAYRHAYNLANSDFDLSRSPHGKWSRFRRQLQQGAARAELLQLREMINDGPVALLSETPYYKDSERRVVVEALYSIRPGFTFQCIDPIR